jgi:hypothetical protein
MWPLTASQHLREHLRVPETRALLEPVLEKVRLDEFLDIYWPIDTDERGRRTAYEDLGDMLRHAERLLLGEFVDLPIHRADLHARQIQVITLAISDLLHPDKMREPRKASHAYNDLARRRLATWFWAATFTPELRLTGSHVEDEARALAKWVRSTDPVNGASLPEVVAKLQVPPVTWLHDVSYSHRDWKYRAVLALLARENRTY